MDLFIAVVEYTGQQWQWCSYGKQATAEKTSSVWWHY